ncbi:MAG: DNA-binding protein, partial [Deltaproteobacteria bacterium]|nr:DNA-binding protein [Deltaproteobacteria bacterium]
MEYKVGNLQRIFWCRLDDGEDLLKELTNLARRENIAQATITVLGALGQAELVIGPKEKVIPPDSVWSSFTDAREIIGFGTMAPGPDGPSIHMHLTTGRDGQSTEVGCLRRPSQVYLTVEAVVMEMSMEGIRRWPDPAFGVSRLNFS